LWEQVDICSCREGFHTVSGSQAMLLRRCLFWRPQEPDCWNDGRNGRARSGTNHTSVVRARSHETNKALRKISDRHPRPIAGLKIPYRRLVDQSAPHAARDPRPSGPALPVACESHYCRTGSDSQDIHIGYSAHDNAKKHPSEADCSDRRC
jgi:hypothetical protein